MLTEMNTDPCIIEWRKLLKRFNDLAEKSPEPKSIEKELLKIKEDAKNSAFLTFRQVDALFGRCDNYLNGQYGNTKTALQMSQSKTGFAKAS